MEGCFQRGRRACGEGRRWRARACAAGARGEGSGTVARFELCAPLPPEWEQGPSSSYLIKKKKVLADKNADKRGGKDLLLLVLLLDLRGLPAHLAGTRQRAVDLAHGCLVSLVPRASATTLRVSAILFFSATYKNDQDATG